MKDHSRILNVEMTKGNRAPIIIPRDLECDAFPCLNIL